MLSKINAQVLIVIIVVVLVFYYNSNSSAELNNLTKQVSVIYKWSLYFEKYFSFLQKYHLSADNTSHPRTHGHFFL